MNVNPEVVVNGRTYRAVPTSCHDDAGWAWVRVEDGSETMIGCVCHHAPANDRVVERLRGHSHDLGHIREDFVAGMVAAYETTQQSGATAADREKIHDLVGRHLKALRDRQYTLREARRTFGSELHGIALLFHLEARTSLSGDSEALARLVPLRDLGWPTDVLMDEYRDEGVVWEPWQRGRFDTFVESWKLAHPQNGVG